MDDCARTNVSLDYGQQCGGISLRHDLHVSQGRLIGHIHHPEHPHFLLWPLSTLILHGE